ncbi:four-carbon acid sugar kinase family protein [Synechocystis salina]|uniref:Four-carbon acid sugar kinase family protein n=2 Tax=Synechocystis TaxID=1142 RepID=A0ABR9VUL4_9SYNC|nr:four-carbon acid sugar kinase family protein [Synechocystis salina]MBE9240674.1 four-carbon acid sugar kinase family protein [Synechocystis salina LEGE 00041]MBE9253926.1 four-carbon acid sugar kinase family protein [Synechocystis salina LEGE 00031]
MADPTKIIVIDDDPTGSQTVHSCLLLMQWDVATLRRGLQDQSPIFFILSNTRALPPAEAEEVVTEICQNLKLALAAETVDHYLVVSRSDSTLRGHYPLETDVINRELGPFDAHFLVPAFFEGGRVTKDSVHYLIVDGELVPVAATEFAQDSVFGYHHSYLPDYVTEKTQGKIGAAQVERITLGDLSNADNASSDKSLGDRLMGFSHNQCVVVDGETQKDFDCLAKSLLIASGQGKHFLLRSAASILTSLANLGPQPVAPVAMASYKPTDQPGVILVGSHVQKTTEQLMTLLKDETVQGIEIPVQQLRDHPDSEAEIIANALTTVNEIRAGGKTPVIYTSRGELSFASVQARLDFGVTLSQLLMKIVQQLPQDIGFLISKGGITSNDVLSVGLQLTSVRLLGQIIPGCSLVRTAQDHPRFPLLPVVLFPGNVGNARGLATVYERLSRKSNS